MYFYTLPRVTYDYSYKSEIIWFTVLKRKLVLGNKFWTKKTTFNLSISEKLGIRFLPANNVIYIALVNGWYAA